jgi:chromosome segregation ATPase
MRTDNQKLMEKNEIFAEAIARLLTQCGKADLAAEYQRIIKEVLLCDPIPSKDRQDGQLEPPWEVIKRVREERGELYRVNDAFYEQVTKLKADKEGLKKRLDFMENVCDTSIQRIRDLKAEQKRDRHDLEKLRLSNRAYSAVQQNLQDYNQKLRTKVQELEGEVKKEKRNVTKVLRDIEFIESAEFCGENTAAVKVESQQIDKVGSYYRDDFVLPLVKENRALSERCWERFKRIVELSVALREQERRYDLMVQRFKTMSTVEMMCENQSVKDHVTEWEGRCLRAEFRVEQLQEDIKWRNT